MNKDNLITSIKSEIDYYDTQRLRQNPPYARLEADRLDLIDRYMLSQYRDGDTDSFGQPMVFYNIVSFPVEVSSKMIDFDTKDIRLIDEHGSYWETWLMEKELRFWMKDKYFGRQLNQWAYNLPKDGHIVLKKVGNDVIVVPLKNLRFRPDAENLTKTPIIEKHEYYFDEFEKEAKKHGWDNWREVQKATENVTGGYFEKSSNKLMVYEAWFPEGFIDGKNNWFLVSYDGKILAEAEMDEIYKGHAWEKLDERLLGRGQVEKLLNEQIYLNRIANYKADALYWSSWQGWQTRDGNMNVNLRENKDNGEILTVNDPLTKIDVQDKNLSFYGYEESRIEQNAVRRGFSHESVTGERAPASKPMGTSMLEAKMASGFYDQKKEELAMFVKEILWDWILPDFKKEKRKEHKLLVKALIDSEGGAEKFFEMRVNNEMNKELVKGYMPPEVKEIKRSLIAEKIKNSKLKIPKGLYDNLKYKMEIDIVGESIDTAGKLTTLQTLFQIIGSNPAVVKDPMVKNILFKMLNLAGFNPRDFKFEEEISSLQEAGAKANAMRGGSIAAPQTPQAPQSMPQTATV